MNLKRERRIWRFRSTRAAKEGEEDVNIWGFGGAPMYLEGFVVDESYGLILVSVMTDTSEISREGVLVLELRLNWFGHKMLHFSDDRSLNCAVDERGRYIPANALNEEITYHVVLSKV
jgi:hypothetical protein